MHKNNVCTNMKQTKNENIIKLQEIKNLTKSYRINKLKKKNIIEIGEKNVSCVVIYMVVVNTVNCC